MRLLPVQVRDFTTSFQNSFKGEQLPPKKDKRVKMVQVRNFYREVTTVRPTSSRRRRGMRNHSVSHKRVSFGTNRFEVKVQQ